MSLRTACGGCGTLAADMNLHQLDTPALVLDLDRVAANVECMATRLRTKGVALRPHVKTAKCADVAAMMVAGQPGGITVSTVAEAEYFFSLGYRDITYAVGIAARKLDRLAALSRRGAKISVLLDTPAQVDAVATAGQRLDLRFNVLVEIDSDGHRAGVRPDDPRLVEIGTALANGPGTRLAGLLTHAGGSYDCRSEACLRDIAARERQAVVTAAERLRSAGLTVDTISVGSTPTALFGESFEGVTEVRAGVYVFFDLVMANLGVCRIDDVALSLLCTVIGHQADRNWLVTDAGWTALSRDRGTANQLVDYGYGLARDVTGQALEDELVVVSTSQEHGVLAARDGQAFDLSRYPVGTRLRILPNHACATATGHDGYHVVAGPDPTVRHYWSRCRGW